MSKGSRGGSKGRKGRMNAELEATLKAIADMESKVGNQQKKLEELEELQKRKEEIQRTIDSATFTPDEEEQKVETTGSKKGSVSNLMVNSKKELRKSQDKNAARAPRGAKANKEALEAIQR